jgi:CheY-like chemotaxis protein
MSECGGTDATSLDRAQPAPPPAAARSCDALHPDWVLIDVDLGGPDVLAIVGEIRLAYPAIRIVALGEDSPRLQEAALCAGARAYLAREQLVLLKRLLRGELA